MILPLLAWALANEDGKPGAAISGCTCHGAPSQDTTVEITPDTLAVELGGLVNFSVVVRNAQQAVAGLTVDSPSGSFAAGENTLIERDDVVHPAPVDLVSGAATFSFVWTAPNEDSSVKIYSAGNAGNDDSEDEGDEWNFGDDVVITVGEGGPLDTGDPADSGTSAGDEQGCSGCASLGPQPGWAVLLACVAWLRRAPRLVVPRCRHWSCASARA